MVQGKVHGVSGDGIRQGIHHRRMVARSGCLHFCDCHRPLKGTLRCLKTCHTSARIVLIQTDFRQALRCNGRPIRSNTGPCRPFCSLNCTDASAKACHCWAVWCLNQESCLQNRFTTCWLKSERCRERYGKVLSAEEQQAHRELLQEGASYRAPGLSHCSLV